MKTKTILKRVLTLILTLLMLFSTTTLGFSAAEVEVADTGVNHTGGYIYFLKPSTWTETYVMMFIGHSSYTSVYSMTKVTNTDNLYRYTCPSWSGATYVAFANSSSLWGSGSWGSSNRTNATHYTNVYNNYGYNSGSYYVHVPASTSNNASISINYKSSYSNLNLTTRANVYAQAVDATSYSSTAAAGTVSVSGYYMSAYGTASTRSAVSSTSSTAYASTTLAPGSTATFKATANEGYEFVGWSTSSAESGIVSDSETYTYSYGISYTAKTVYALFKQKSVTATFNDYNGNTLDTQTIAYGSTPTVPADPTRTGYTFTGWDKTIDAITEDTTYTATYTINSHTVTVTANPVEGGTVTGGGTYDYGTEVTLTANPDSANGYAFMGWNLSGTEGTDYEITDGSTTSATVKIKVYADVTATADFQQAVTHTVKASANISGAGSVGPTNQEVAEGGSIELTATANEGYRFDSWEISGDYTTEGNLSDSHLVIHPTGDVTATAVFVKTYNVVFKDYDGTVLRTQVVDEGDNATAPDAPTRDNYTFAGWDTAFTNVQSDLTVTATYTGNEYTVTVTVNPADGGTATANGLASATVNYNGSVDLVATPVDGYVFTGWSFSSDDYEGNVNLKDKEITIIPTADITVTAQFDTAQYLTVHSFSESGNNTLTVTESDGTDTNKPIDGVQQPYETTFGNVTWSTSETVLLTNGYSDSVIATLSGQVIDASNSANWYVDGEYLVSDEYYTIIFENNWLWTDVCLYAYDSNGVYNAVWPGEAMTKAGTGDGHDVYVFLVPKEKNYTTIIINGIKNDGSGDRNETPKIALTDLTTGAAYDYEMLWDGTNSTNAVQDSGLTIVTRSDKPTVDIDLTDTLYTEGAWNGVEEVWITDTGIVTLRNALADAIDYTSDKYNDGINESDYTAESWNLFTAAYGNAYRLYGSQNSTQETIDAAVKSLYEAYHALETNTYADVTITQNVLGEVLVGNQTVTQTTEVLQVAIGSEVSVMITAPDGYYIASVNGLITSAGGIESLIAPITLTENTGAIDIVYALNPTVTVNHTGATGTATVGGNDAASPVTVTYGSTPTVSVIAPEGYYIAAITVDGVAIDEITSADPESYLRYDFALSAVEKNRIINVTYGVRATYTIKVNYSNTLGVLYYNDEALAEDAVITVYSNDTVTITAVANEYNYGISYWVVDGVITGSREISHTLSEITDNHTVSIEWTVLNPITITVGSNEALAGSATATAGDYTVTNGTIGENGDILQQSVVTLTATKLDPCYEFVSWSIEGSYYTTVGDIYSENLTIVANSSLKITANYELTYRKIYVDNTGAWTNVYFYIYDGDVVYKEWPGTKMTYDSSIGYYVGYVPIDATGTIMFHQYPDSTQTIRQEYSGTDFTDHNLFKTYISSGSASDGAGNYTPAGLYLQGVWNGEEYNAYDLLQFTQNADGTYSVTINVTSAEAGTVVTEYGNYTTEEGYIYVNPSNEKSRFYEASEDTCTVNGQILNTIGTSYVNMLSRSAVKVQIPDYDPNKQYNITFTFNSSTLEFSWVIEELVSTIDVIITDGRGVNAADQNMDTPNDRIGDSYFDDATIHSQVEHFYYTSAQVVAGTATTFYTQVNKNSVTGSYDYYVAGWVLNGTKFISASDMGNGLYSGSYVFTEEADLVPVYFHTDAWLKDNNVSTAYVYIIADLDIVDWNEYMAAYVWYKVDGVTAYMQFGQFPGQLMIPVTGLSNTYYTILETSTGDKIQISGITFNNYANSENIDVSIQPFGYSSVQTYDFYDPIVLLQSGHDNITFGIMNTNDTLNKDRVTAGSNVSLTNNWDFVSYTNYNGDKVDVTGTVITNYDELSDDDALYIIREGSVTVSDGVLDGQFYVKCYFYDATGAYLGWCYTNDLRTSDSDIWTTIGSYVGQRVYVSYESVSTDDRYDGEWYSDIDVSVTVNLSVNVGLTTNGGEDYTIDNVDDVNIADYGTGYINVSKQNVDVERGTLVKIIATPANGYKFIGWYSADGTLFSTNPTATVLAAVATSYTAVFQKLETGNFYVNHYLYTGVGTSTIYIPTAHGGSGQLFVGIENVTQSTSVALTETNSAFIAANENDELIITIATDASGADTFFSWYVSAIDKTGTTFEEVGVNSSDNLYNNGGDVIGSKEMVYFQFRYIVKDGDSYSMTLFSDIISVSVNRKIVYNYNDRYGNIKTYVVPITLTAKEIEGFEGNNFQPYTPAYISGEGYVNTVLSNAPFVDDIYKDVVWTISSTMFDTVTFEFWATQSDTEHMVTINYGAITEIVHATFNSALSFNAVELFGVDADSKGIWFHDVNEDGVYDEGTDIILAYGAKLGQVVTGDMYVSYVEVESYDFGVSLESPVYGREQSTDSEGNVTSDKVLVDYIVNILTTEFYVNGDEPTYNGQTITGENWNGHQYTLEDMAKEFGYSFEYGVILEQVGTWKESVYTLDVALTEAQNAGYGTATDSEILNNAITTVLTSSTNKGMYEGKYYTFYNNVNTSLNDLTNKNRLLFTISYTNNESNRGKYFNVYGYIKVTDADGNSEYYFSNVQTLNIYETAKA